MNIRKAIKSDISAIERIYNIIHDGEEKGITTIGWIRSIYPTRKTAQDALDRDDLFVIEDEDKIVSSAIINHIQYEQYRHAAWKHVATDDEVMVLHTLVVDPNEKSKGYGSNS